MRLELGIATLVASIGLVAVMARPRAEEPRENEAPVLREAEPQPAAKPELVKAEPAPAQQAEPRPPRRPRFRAKNGRAVENTVDGIADRGSGLGAAPTEFPVRPGYDELLIPVDRIGDTVILAYCERSWGQADRTYQLTVPDGIPEGGFVRLPLPESPRLIGLMLDGEMYRKLAPRETVPIDVPASRFVAAYSKTSGCMGSWEARRWSMPSDEGYVDEEGRVLSREKVARLRDRLLGSRPGPGGRPEEVLSEPDAFLAEAGITRESFARDRESIARSSLDRGWQDTKEDPVELPGSVMDRFTFDAFKVRMAEYALFGEQSTTSMQHLIRIPGEPRIVVGSDRMSPDYLPWYVRCGDEAWYLTDREVARELIDLLGDSSCVRPQKSHDESLLGSLLGGAGIRHWLQQELDRALTVRSYEAVPGYADVAAEFQVEFGRVHSRGRANLPYSFELVPREPGAIDRVVVANSASLGWSPDWFHVLAGFDALEPALAELEWVDAWKEATGGAVELDYSWRKSSGFEEESPSLALHAWREAGLDGERPFIVRLLGPPPAKERARRAIAGRALMSAAGTLLFFEVAKGGLPGELQLSPGKIDAGAFTLLRPGGEAQSGKLDPTATLNAIEQARQREMAAGCDDASIDRVD